MAERTSTPIGLELAGVAREVNRAFDAALAAAGGSLPTWQIVLALYSGQAASQRELARVVGVRGATLSHHLDGMEAGGLLTRRRDPGNRRVHLVDLTDEGRAVFRRLRDVAVEHDRRLRAGCSDADLDVLRRVLGRMRENVAGGDVDGPGSPPGP